jgi:transposase
MPWKEESSMSQKKKFVLLASNVRELCRRYGISSRTGHKWINRYQKEGESDLEEVPRRSAIFNAASILPVGVGGF